MWLKYAQIYNIDADSSESLEEPIRKHETTGGSQ